MSIDASPTVFGADEQHDVAIDVARWVRLAQLVLDGIEGLVFVELGSRDVVRHRIVQEIVDAYGRHEGER